MFTSSILEYNGYGTLNDRERTILQQTIKADTGWRIWWQLTRPHTLTAAFAPVFLGTMIALTYGKSISLYSSPCSSRVFSSKWRQICSMNTMISNEALIRNSPLVSAVRLSAMV